MIEIIPIGGYSEVGRNCTLIKVDNEAVIIDMGLHLEHYIKFTEDEDVEGFLSPKALRSLALEIGYKVGVETQVEKDSKERRKDSAEKCYLGS